MTDAEILSRIAAGEDSRTQFKRGPIGVAKFASELTAFANAEGGVIIFGVDDDGSIVGLDTASKKALNDELSNASNDNVRPAIYPRTEYHTLDDKVILAVIIPEGVSKPYSDKSGNFWTKSGPDKRRITSREELQRLLQKSLLIHADELPVPGSSWQDLDINHICAFLKKNYKISSEDALADNASEARRVFSNLGLLKNDTLTLSGVLLFGNDPQRFRRIDVVKCVHFPGTELSDIHYVDSQDFTGPIRDLFKGTMAFLERNLRHEQAGQNFNSIGIPVIPIEALEEYVINMLLHRDYFVNSPWRVFVFSDRIELISPGSLPDHLTIEQMKSGVSIPRNSVLFSLAIKDGLPYRGIGSGVGRALQLYNDVEFVNDEDGLFFKTIIRLNPTVNENPSVNPSVNLPEAKNLHVNLHVNPSEGENLPVNLPVNPSEGENLHVNLHVKPSEGENLHVNLHVNLPENLSRLLTYLSKNPAATYADMALFLGKAIETIRVYLNQLKNPPYSLIRRVGSDKTGHWEILKGGAQ